MASYVSIAIFAAFAIFVPAGFLLTAKLLGRKSSGNPIRNAPYESGEETIGTSRDVDNEYMPHFMIFLPFEIVVAILILWSTVASSMSYYSSIAIIMLGIVAVVLSGMGYKLSSG
jgi:NADH:ubiquinone oxidoreductase subunit 3 (subunit A)